MIFLLLVSILIAPSFCYKTEEIEVFCPNGWLAQGQAIYVKNITNIANESEYSLCLVCQKNSSLPHPYEITEVCVSTSQLLLNIESKLQCKSAVCKFKPSTSKQNWTLLDHCDTMDYQPVCGMKINMTDMTLKEAMDDVEFVFCKDLNNDHLFPDIKLYSSVDLICPKGSTFESVNVREGVIKKNGGHAWTNSGAICLICDPSLKSRKTKINLCSTILCSSFESKAPHNLKVNTEFQLSTCGKVDSTCYQNATDLDKYCGYRYITTCLKVLSLI